MTFWRNRISFVMVVGLCAYSSQPAPAEDDHGDSPGASTWISTDGTPIAGSIDHYGDLDYFQFTATGGNLYDILTADLKEGCDTYLILFDTDGVTPLAEDDQGGEEPNAARILFSATREGRYYVEVSHFFLGGLGTYSLSVENLGAAPPDDHGDNAETASLILLGTPVAGSIEVPGDVDFFAFVPQTGSFYDIETFDLPIGSDTYLGLYGPDGTTEIATDDQGGREWNASRIIWRATSLEPYFASVRQFLPGGTGDYSLMVTDLGEPRYATPDGPSQAGTIPSSGDVDVFELPVLAGHRYRIEVADGATGGFEIELRDGSGLDQLDESRSGDPCLEFLATDRGSYFALVREEISGGDYLFGYTHLGLAEPWLDFNYDDRVDSVDLFLFENGWHAPPGTPTPVPVR